MFEAKYFVTQLPNFMDGDSDVAKSKVSEDDFALLLEKLSLRSSQRNLPLLPAVTESKDSNFLKFSTTGCAKWSQMSAKKRFEIDVMRRVLDNVHHPDVCATILSSKGGNLGGVPWKKSASIKEKTAVVSSLGPGSYDTSAYYSSNQKGNPVSAINYDDSKKICDNIKWERKMKNLCHQQHTLDSCEAASDSTAIRYREDEVPENDRKIKMKFPTSTRWNRPEQREPQYVKTTGMQLTLDYDQKFDKRIPISLNGRSERDCVNGIIMKPMHDVKSNFSPNVGYGNQASFLCCVERSPLKFSKAFKSKVASGNHYVIPTSGCLIGPGSFPGAELSGVRIRNPDKQSPAFLVYRPYNHPIIANQDSLVSLATFGDVNRRGSVFSQECVSGTKNNHLAEWTRKKIIQIYPRLKSYDQ